jgi:hypothetical protein
MTQYKRLALINKALENGWLSERFHKNHTRVIVNLDCYGADGLQYSEIQEIRRGELTPRTLFKWHYDEELVLSNGFADAVRKLL